MRIYWGIILGLILGCTTPISKHDTKDKPPENPLDIKLSPSISNPLFKNLKQHTMIQTTTIKVTHPSVSRDGKILVYASNEASQNRHLFLKSLDSNATMQLTNGNSENWFPDVSPDGKRVAFCSNRTGNWDVYVLHIDSPSSIAQVTLSTADEIAPSWSPDGKRLVCSMLNQYGVWQIVIYDVATRTPTFLVPGIFPRWSRHAKLEDQLIAYQELPRGEDYKTGIWTVKPDGSDIREVASDKTGTVSYICPSWSPDGKWVVFASARSYKDSLVFDPNEQAEDLWYVKEDGNFLTRLSLDAHNDWWPVWGGDKVFFVSNREKPQNIFSIGLPKELE